MAQTIFWVCLALILYHHVIYPLLLPLLARLRKPTSVHLDTREATAEQPSVTIIIPCHNEARVIARKIENLAALDYARDRLSVVLALDGCTDETRNIAEAALKKAGDLDFRLVSYENNIGKVAVLNDQISRATSEIVALSDASSLLGPDALLRAATHFGAPDVGVVCPAYRVVDASNPGEQAYWAYQSRVRLYEATLAAPMGAHGAFYLVSRTLWSVLEPDTINDDFVLPMRIVADGHRAVYDPEIVATELEPSSPNQEFRRRVRIGAGNFQQFVRLLGLADPRRPWLSFIFCSGKGLRAVMPFVLLACFLSSLVLAAGSWFYAIVVTLEFFAIVLAASGALMPRAGYFSVLKLTDYFLVGHLASGVGALLLLSGQGDRAWRFSKRQSGAAAVPLAN
ncbi:MAG TPA: glycosyltransferase family 2 protein [Pseudolabrys sp.]|nr:glycosyltransferase family 2 protein [Pseudolabrys sp.]